MTTKTWDGSTNDFNLPQHWSPYGTPQNGDTAVIHSGFAELAFGDLRDAPVDLGSTDPNHPAVFANYDDFLGNVTVHGSTAPASGPNAYPATYAQMNVSGGGDIGIGNLAIGASDYTGEQNISGNLQMYLAPGAQFVSTGGVTLQGNSTFDVHGSAQSSFVNDSSLVDLSGHIDMQVPVVGSGSITVGVPRFQGSDLTFENYVTGGQQITVGGSGLGMATVTLNDPQGFAAGVTLNPNADLILAVDGSQFDYSNGVFTVMTNTGLSLASFQLNIPSNTGLSVKHSGYDTVLQAAPGAPSSPAIVQQY